MQQLFGMLFVLLLLLSVLDTSTYRSLPCPHPFFAAHFAYLHAQAVQPGKALQQHPLFADSQGGLSKATNLTRWLPSGNFTLSEAQPVEAVGRCFGSGDTDECAKINSTWSVYQATYADKPDSPIYICVFATALLSMHEAWQQTTLK